MKKPTKRQRRRIGDIVKIELGDGYHTYGRVIEGADFAFYDCRSRDNLPIEQIISSPILFYISVMNYAITRGIWTVVGNAPLDTVLQNPPPSFIQDVQQPDVFRIYEKGGNIRPATREECEGLECAAVWDPEHVEDRLRDHYAGQKNKWVESLKIKDDV